MTNKEKDIALKSEFITHFLHNYQLSIRQSIWILNIFAKNKLLLEKLNFVEDCSSSKIGIRMKTITAGSGFDLSFYTNGSFTSNDPQNIYEFIRSFETKENGAIFLFPNFDIQLVFNEKDTDPLYQAIVKQTDISNALASPSNNEFIYRYVREEDIDAFIHQIHQENLPSIFLNKINESLDSRDEALFFSTLEAISNAGLSLDSVLQNKKTS